MNPTDAERRAAEFAAAEFHESMLTSQVVKLAHAFDAASKDSRSAAIREVIELMGTWRTQYAADGWGHIADAFTHRISSLRSHFADDLKEGT